MALTHVRATDTATQPRSGRTRRSVATPLFVDPLGKCSVDASRALAADAGRVLSAILAIDKCSVRDHGLARYQRHRAVLLNILKRDVRVELDRPVDDQPAIRLVLVDG